MPNYVYIPLTQDRMFLVFNMDSKSGKLSLNQEVKLSAQPWQLCTTPNRKYLYQQIRDDGYSGVATFQIDQNNGKISQIGEISLEEDSCYVNTDKTGRFLLAAYLIPGMVTVHKIGDDGAVLQPVVDRKPTELYAHSIVTDSTNRYAFVPHTAPTDTVYQFLFDNTTGKLEPNFPRKIKTIPEHGPRHIAFHPELDIIYANSEEASCVTVYSLDKSNGTLNALQTLSTLPDHGFDGESRNATVRVHPTGKAIYITNRGHDSISMFSADTSTGLLTSMGQQITEKCPRTLAIEPNGNFLFAGGDHSGRVASYRINKYDLVLEPLEIYDLGMWPSWILPVEIK